MATLLASGLGGPGGVYALGEEGFTALDTMASTGLALSPGGDRLARLLYNGEDPEAPGELLVYDDRGVALYRRIDALREPHGALWHGDEIVVVSTLGNAVLWLDACGEVRRTWRAPGAGDAWHLNNLVVHDGRLLVSAFGRFGHHRGWAEAGAARGRGIVLDPLTGEDALTGLDCPHDPTPLDGGWLLCNSAGGELVRLDARGAAVERRPLGGWPRGLAYDDERVYVGVSAHRLARTRGSAAVVALDRSTLTEVERWTLPAPEVFALVWAPPALVDGLSAGFASPALAARTGAEPDAGPAPLAESDCDAPIAVAETPPPERGPSTMLALAWRLQNAGRATLASAGPTPVHVGARWVRADSGTVVEESRARLPHPVGPGETAEGTIELWCPADPGDYLLRLSAVQEHVRWFDDVDPANCWWVALRVTDQRPA